MLGNLAEATHSLLACGSRAHEAVLLTRADFSEPVLYFKHMNVPFEECGRGAQSQRLPPAQNKRRTPCQAGRQ